MSKKISLRWQMRDGQRIFIVYGTRADAQAVAQHYGYTQVQASGYYDYSTNTIRDAKDGSIVIQQGHTRPSGRYT